MGKRKLCSNIFLGKMASLDREFSLFDEDETTAMGSIHLRILSTSDVYDFGNWANFYTAVQDLKLPEEEGNYNILVIPGDFLAPSVISCIDGGAMMVECLNAVGFQYCIFGNHESDVSTTALAQRIRDSNFTWINSNMTNMPDLMPKLPEYVKLDFKSETQTRSIALIGLLTDDKYLYRQGAFGGAKIKPVADTALRLHEKLKNEVDCVIPLTHQSMAHDRHLALVGAGKFPVILGAHDHSPFTETVAGIPIIKAGMDAINLAITDIVWPSFNTPGESPDVSIQLVPVKRFERNPEIAKMVTENQARVLGSLDAAHIMDIRPGVELVSRNIRVDQRTVGRLITSLLRDSLLGDCCILPSGTIRRGFIYPADHLSFNYRDLVSELPFDDDAVVVDYPGEVIEATIKFSHGPLRKGMGGFLQVDSGIELDEESNIVMINGENFDKNRKYRMVVNILALEGIDENIPMIQYFNLPVSQGGYNGEGPREGDPRRVPLKLSLQAVIARRRLVEIWNSHVHRPDGVLAGEEARYTPMSKEEFCKEEINRNAPDWFMDQFFSLADWDNDGVIGHLDVAIANIFCWLSGPISGVEVDPYYRIDSSGMTTTDELCAHLETVIPKQTAEKFMKDIVDNSAFVTRNDVFNWLDNLKQSGCETPTAVGQ